jgi:phosphoribosylformylglycinamidine synthase
MVIGMINVLIRIVLSPAVVEMFVADIRIKLKKGVADPEGKNTRKALELLGFSEVADVKTSKFFSIRLDAQDEASAKAAVDRICLALLANPVINEYSFELRREA